MKQYSMNGQDPEHIKMGFGPLLEERKGGFKWGSLWSFVFAVAALVVGSIYLCNVFLFMGTNSFVERFISHDYWIWAIMAVGGLIGTISMLRTWIRERDSKAELYEKGFYIKSSGKELAYKYDEIKDIWLQVTHHYTNGIKTGSTVNSRIETKDGQDISFNVNHFSQNVKLAEAIVTQIEKIRFPEVLEDFKQGKKISMGPLTLSQEGIETSKGLLPWGQLSKLQTYMNGYNFKLVDIEGKTFDKYLWSVIPSRGIFIDLVLTKVPDVQY